MPGNTCFFAPKIQANIAVVFLEVRQNCAIFEV